MEQYKVHTSKDLPNQIPSQFLNALQQNYQLSVQDLQDISTTTKEKTKTKTTKTMRKNGSEKRIVYWK